MPEVLSPGKAGKSRRSCTYHVVSMLIMNSNDPRSYHAGRGPEGKSYEGWCGEDYEKNVLDPYDDYLHEAFCKSSDSLYIDRWTSTTDIVIAPEIRAKRALAEQSIGPEDQPSDEKDENTTAPGSSRKGKEVELTGISESKRRKLEQTKENRKALKAAFGPKAAGVKGSASSSMTPESEESKTKKKESSKTQTQPSEHRVSLRNKQNT